MFSDWSRFFLGLWPANSKTGGDKTPFRINFVDLPTEIKVACLEYCFENWSLTIREKWFDYYPYKTTVPNGLELMTVCKDFQTHVKLALLRKFDRKLDLGGPASSYHFEDMVKHCNISWMTEKIEYLTVGVPVIVPPLRYLNEFDSLRLIDLMPAIERSSPDGVPLRTVYDVLCDETLNDKVLREANRHCRDMNRNFPEIRKLLQERKVQMYGTWRYEAHFGNFPPLTLFPSMSYISMKVDLSTDLPMIIERKAQLDNGQGKTVTDEQGKEYLFWHYLNWVWADVRNTDLPPSIDVPNMYRDYSGIWVVPENE